MFNKFGVFVVGALAALPAFAVDLPAKDLNDVVTAINVPQLVTAIATVGALMIGVHLALKAYYLIRLQLLLRDERS